MRHEICGDRGVGAHSVFDLGWVINRASREESESERES